MKKIYLEKFLGEYVKIKLFDNSTYEGFLHKTGEEQFSNNLNLYIPKNKYFLMDNGELVSCVFRSSHVVNLDYIDYYKKIWKNT